MFMLHGFYMCVCLCVCIWEGCREGVISHGPFTQRQQEKQEDLHLAETHTESSAAVRSEYVGLSSDKVTEQPGI